MARFGNEDWGYDDRACCRVKRAGDHGEYRVEYNRRSGCVKVYCGSKLVDYRREMQDEDDAMDTAAKLVRRLP